MRRTTLGARMAISFFIFLGLASGGVSPSIAQENNLQARYLWGSIYVSHIPLTDMKSALNRRDNFNRLAEQAPGEAVLLRFKAFLDQMPLYMNESFAFLQLNLITHQAGYKMLSDRDGVIHPIAWSKEVVDGIAEFCDRSLNRLQCYETTRKAIASWDNTMTIEKAWEAAGNLVADPHIPPEKAATLVTSLRQMLDQRSGEWQRLKESGNDRILLERIDKFKTDYDTLLQRIQEKIGKAANVEDLPDRRAMSPEDLKKADELEREWNDAVIKIAPRPGKSERPATQPPGPSVVPKQDPRKE